MTFAGNVILFNRSLSLKNINLPKGIRAMNPFEENQEAKRVSEAFYRKFYNDNNERSFIIGINPGRFGAGVTGIPFTDPKRLISECGINYEGKMVHEPSSVFVYEVIHAFGGPEKFYEKFYINSVCPLGFTSTNNKKNKEVNYNYYDDPKLFAAVKPFIIEKLKEQINFGLNREKAFCLGTGKNFKVLKDLNDELHFFKETIPLPHPRFIVQYKQKEKDLFIREYLEKLDF